MARSSAKMSDELDRRVVNRRDMDLSETKSSKGGLRNFFKGRA